MQESLIKAQSRPLVLPMTFANQDLEVEESCDRLFLEEFEDLNRPRDLSKEADKKLSFSQEICSGKGFQRQK